MCDFLSNSINPGYCPLPFHLINLTLKNTVNPGTHVNAAAYAIFRQTIV